MKYRSVGSCGLLLYAVLFLVVLQGCARQTTVVLLPDPAGRVGHITVKNEKGSVEMDKAGQATVVRGKQAAPGQPEVISDEKIQADVGAVLEALPAQPVHFLLYFQRDSTRLAENSDTVLKQVMQSIKDRQSKNVTVCAHTDTAGDQQYNMNLSRRRAAAIGKLLVGLGVNPEYISTTSHGENNPLIITPDNTSEPRNRRVEIIVK